MGNKSSDLDDWPEKGRAFRRIRDRIMWIFMLIGIIYGFIVFVLPQLF